MNDTSLIVLINYAFFCVRWMLYNFCLFMSSCIKFLKYTQNMKYLKRGDLTNYGLGAFWCYWMLHQFSRMPGKFKSLGPRNRHLTPPRPHNRESDILLTLTFSAHSSYAGHGNAEGRARVFHSQLSYYFILSS